MKAILIIVIVGLLVLAGCSPTIATCPDISKEMTAAKEVIKEYGKLEIKKDSLEVELVNLNAKYNLLQVNNSCPATTNMSELLASMNTTTNSTNCLVYIQRLSNLEEDLETCYMNDSYSNYKDLYKACKIDRDEYEEEIDDLEVELNDTLDDLLDCES